MSVGMDVLREMNPRARLKRAHRIEEREDVMDDTRLLEEMTWPEVREAIEAGRTTVVVAVGAVEQHGPHLPLLVDAARGDRLAVEVATRLGDALVGPTIRIGCSEHHMGFPGTVSLRRNTLEAICLDYTVSLARHGFEWICFVPSHGGNFGPLAEMLPDLRAAVAPSCRVDAYTDLIGFMELWQAAVRERAPDLVERVGGHADVAETSEMLCIRPDLVRQERAEEGHMQTFDQELQERIFREGLRAVTPNGVLGDARGATPEIGEACITAAADGVVAALEG
jgi:creatinine amidohydrolase